MGLDRAQADEELLRDLPIGLAGGGELGDAPLARGQGVRAAQQLPPGAGAGALELIVCAALEGGGAEPVREVEPAAQWLASRAALAGAAKQRAEFDQGPASLQRRRRALEHAHRFAQHPIPAAPPSTSPAAISALPRGRGAP